MFRGLLIGGILILTGCGGNNSTNINKDNHNKNILSINGDFSIQKYNLSTFSEININKSNKDLILIFTNPTDKDYTIKLIENSYFKEKTEQIVSKKEPKRNTSSFKNILITDFNHKKIPKDNISSISESKLESIKEREKIFYLKKDKSISTLAILKKRTKNIKTRFGHKTLNIWVSKDSYGEDCNKLYCIQDYMIEYLAESFLKEGLDNDIYDWVTDIYGEEWGDIENSNLIKNQNEINILLTDIKEDNRVVSGVFGYFYAKDNYKKSVYSGSNEMLMFYIDSVLFASHYGEDGWNMDGLQQKKITSTLAHEFVHMIHFYQRNVLKDRPLSPWIDELLAVSTEDLLATKLKSMGTRGVEYSRGDAGDMQNPYGPFPTFNKNIDKSLTEWKNRWEDYAMVASFGAYLIRNYNGAEILHNILHNNYTNKEAIVYAINRNREDKESFGDILQNWAIAIMVSSNDNIDKDNKYIYNIGDFIETTYKNNNYSLGSIDFFKYENLPKILTNTKKININPNSNIYYKIPKDNFINITIEANPNIKLALVKR